MLAKVYLRLKYIIGIVEIPSYNSTRGEGEIYNIVYYFRGIRLAVEIKDKVPINLSLK